MAELIKDPDKKCIFVVGPTASGKSAWALEQSEKFQGSIVNIDSIQLYKDLIIGSAAPTEYEKTRIPHYLYSYVKAPYEMTAGDYLKDFYQLFKKDMKFPLFIVGGTGFYIQALEKGMFDVEPIPQEFRKNLENELQLVGPEKLHRELKEKDPDTKIHINDHFRLVRALEIIRYTGEIPSRLKGAEVRNKNEFPFPFIKVGFNFEKNKFEELVKIRTKKMIENGIIEETKKIRDQGLTDWAPLQSVGYKETSEFINSGKNTKWLFDSINQSTLQLIKKQKTWFKRDAAILWSNQEQELMQFLS